jgi:membrane protease YdiL (CAAX protease family)
MSNAPTGRGFWDRPATWKAFLVVLGYLVYYLAVSQLIGLLFGDEIDPDNVMADATSMFFALVLPIGLGAIGLLAFAGWLGWLRDIFGPQPIGGRRWMWIAPVLVLVAIVGHVGGIEWSQWSPAQVAMMAVAGVCIGMAEELATRGLAVKMLRDAAHSERFVAIVSSLLFALMHVVNLISGMSVSTVAATVGYTFCFGMCMYLSMRVTGTIWAAIVLHGLTDPTTFLATGGIDEAVTSSQGSGWALLAAGATIAFMVLAVVAIFLIRGKVDAAPRAPVVPA